MSHYLKAVYSRSTTSFLFLLSSLMITGCGSDEFLVSERTFSHDGHEFTIKGKMGGDSISLTYELRDEVELTALSFGIDNTTKVFNGYGGQKKIEVLSESSVKAYMNDYVKPGIGCPAWFMNKHLRSIILIAADNEIAESLAHYDIPFDSLGTEFSLKGHYLDHINERYVENDKKINLRIVENIHIMSNVGSAKRPVKYFLVTEI